MNTFKALMEREYWEHRGAFRSTPLITGIVILVLMLIGVLLSYKFENEFSGDGIISYGVAEFSKMSPDNISMISDGIMLSTGSIYHMILFVVMFFFLLGSLYDDRKDGSILFWKSLPVSDLQTVLSKIVMAVIVVPILYTGILILAHIAIYILLSLIMLINGQNPFTTLIANTNFFSNWWAYIVGCFAQAIWALPIYGWLMLCSAWSKRRPFLWAVLVPMILTFMWGTLNALIDFNFREYAFFQDIGIQLAKAISPFGSIADETFSMGYQKGDSAGFLISNIMSSLWQTRHIYALSFAIITIGLSVYLRRYRNTT